MEISTELASPKYKLNHCYIFWMLHTFMMCTVTHVGWMFAESNMVSPIISIKLGWDVDGTEDIKFQFISTIGMAGLASGCTVGDKLIKMTTKRNMNVLLFSALFV